MGAQVSRVPIAQALELALQQLFSGNLAQAESIYRQVLAIEPENPDAWHLLSVIASQRGNVVEAIQLIRRAIAARPGSAELHSNLAKYLADSNDGGASRDECLAAIKFDPAYKSAWFNLGRAYTLLGQHDNAASAYAELAKLAPSDPGVFVHLGESFHSSGQAQQAVDAYRRAIQLGAGDAALFNNLGLALFASAQTDAAIDACREALGLDPRYAAAWQNLGFFLRDAGDPTASIEAYRNAMQLDPSSSDAHSNLIFSLQYLSGATLPGIRAELDAWRERFARPLERHIQPHTNAPVPDRGLRFGYVSPFFFQQAECYFVLPLLEAHDRTGYEVHCYSFSPHEDSVTERMKACAQGWHDVHKDSDEQLAQRIRNDQIDILVDLSMHMKNRLFAFARKPAPVQVTWLAYPGSTGLFTIDYRLTDAWMDPASGEHDRWYTERSYRLPGCWCCYSPLFDTPPVNSLPARADNRVTFGSLNAMCKMNEEVVALWSKVLLKVAASRLVLLSSSGRAGERLRSQFGRFGIAPDRIELVPSATRFDYLRYYHQIDIALDPFPYNGITTTCDALWMGVPVLTRAYAGLPSSLAGKALLMTAGLPGCVAKSEEGFVRIAAELAGDLPRLTQLRSTLRQQVAASPLMDAPRFARNVEAAYRQMWKTWCETQGASA
jgi:predicted O-linked N-acetylglucosamine transferase (SPINDLY family)